MLEGTFSDVSDVDPLISRVVTEQVYYDTEPVYPTAQWYPVQPGTVNRFLSIDGQSREQLVVVPGQFRAEVEAEAKVEAAATATSTVGVQRLYSELTYEVYHAPFEATDYVAPSIWQVQAISSTHYLRFRVQVTDDSWKIQRTVVLYRTLSSGSWSRVELSYDPITGWAMGVVPPVQGPIEYFAQAVDPTGNVALALDHGNPFREVVAGKVSYEVYLPIVTANYVPPEYQVYLPIVLR